MLTRSPLATMIGVGLVAAAGTPAAAINTVDIPALEEADVVRMLNNPALAARARYGLTDSAGQPMHLPSIVQLSGTAYKYAAAYSTPYAVRGGTRFRVNLAGSNDLMTWTYLGMLVDNAGMAKLTRVPGSPAMILTHEQWLGRRAASTRPSRLGFKLFNRSADLVGRTPNASYLMPSYRTGLNGTPSVYALSQTTVGGRPAFSGTFGFHYWNGSRDVNAVGEIRDIFAATPPAPSPLTLTRYNALLQSRAVTGNVGDRDTLLTTTARYNVQEGNLGRPAGSWNKWRLFLYKFAQPTRYPDGSGTLIPLAPRTPGGSQSFGNATVNVVDRPSGPGKALVVSYFLFHEGAAPGEAGSLLFYFEV